MYEGFYGNFTQLVPNLISKIFQIVFQYGILKKIMFELIKENVPGYNDIDRTWMTTFWETFSDFVIETDALYNVTGILRKTDSSLTTDITGRSFLDFSVDKDREFVESELEILRNTNVPYRRFTFLAVNCRYYRMTLIAKYKNKKFHGLCGIAVDVTQQSLNEIMLYWQSAIIEESADYVAITDMEGNVLFTNPGAYKMSGYDPALGDLPLKDMFTFEYLETIENEGLKIVTEKGHWTNINELICADGRRKPIEHNLFSVRNNKDETILIATIIKDITYFVEYEKELEEKRRVAEAANIAKSEFLSRMSHEIRTPMNAIIGMINIGLEAEDSEKKNYCFKRAEGASKHLLGIINDILDMSKIEADKFELSYSEFNFEQTLKNITNMANIRVEEKHQNFIVNFGSDVPLFLYSDELRLSQVITNLLTNAIKFTPENGTVILKIEKINEKGDDVILKIEVSDNGIGISPDQQLLLFKSFNQADSSISQKFGGTGLGLAISKRIVELMGGRIWIESELGKGSHFIFTMNAKKAKIKTGTKLLKEINREAFHVLAVDDSEEIRAYFLQFMKTLKIPCDVAADGNEAVEMINKSKEKPYNIFFVDWKMPGMDGIELTKKINEISGGNSIVIMISANDWKTIEKDATDAGIKHFISKPLFPSTLIDAINICASAGMNKTAISEEQNTASARRWDFSNYSILIAEDIDINREIMSAILD